MDPLLFGPVDAALMPIIEYVILGLVVLNLVTRYLAHRATVDGFERRGVDGIGHYTPHVAANVLLLVANFYYITVDQHYGVTIGVLILALVLTDFFEVEARRVEARNEMPLERPKAAMGLSVIVLVFAAYIALYFLVEPYWQSVF